MFGDILTINNKINEASDKGIPFLFGFNFELTEGFFCQNPIDQQDILFKVGDVSNFDSSDVEISYKLEKHNCTYDQYLQKYNIIRKGLMHGNSFLANLTAKTPIDLDISLFDVFKISKSLYKIYIPEKFVCFSPECFVKIENNKIFTFPMKGTINSSVENAKNVILNDCKEKAEHFTIVDLMRNDLSKVSKNVVVEKLRYISEIRTKDYNLLQVSSKIAGELPEQSKIGDVLLSLLPAGSISGAPKKATLQLIEEAEVEKRGYYTGVFGYFDGKTLDSAVLIRFIEKNKNALYFRSGGGITVNSCCLDEYNEMINKIYLHDRL